MYELNITPEQMQQARTQRNIVMGQMIAEAVAGLWHAARNVTAIALKRLRKALFVYGDYLPRS